MSSDNPLDHIWRIAEKVGFCMLASHDGRLIRSRPMAAHVDRDKHEISFLTDVNSHKEEEIARDPNVALIFSDTKGQTYASINGVAAISNDRGKVRELWSTAAKAWWDDPDDPAIRVLIVTPQEGQYWDSPGTLVSMVSMLAAAVTDHRPKLGDNETTKM